MNDEIKRHLESHVESTMTNKTELRSAYIELSENFIDSLKEVMRDEGYCVDNTRNFNIEDMEYDVDVTPSISIEKAVELLTDDHGYVNLDEYRTVKNGKQESNILISSRTRILCNIIYGMCNDGFNIIRMDGYFNGYFLLWI